MHLDNINISNNVIIKIKRILCYYNKKFVSIWIKSIIILIIGYFILFGISSSNFLSVKDIIIASMISLIAAITFNYFLLKYNYIIIYILFFLISFCSLVGLSKTLTGSYSQSLTVYTYGLSFYTLTLAYLSKTKKLNINTPFIATNPLLLITGPVATSFKTFYYRSLKNRFNYYFPFIILGIFLQQIIATPLTKTFFLIESTDLVSTIIFGVIFEIFVYSNFCGLSLIIYGILGIIGVKIPLNFKQPFSSKNLVEFWRGWHTSLSTVLKELFYLPIKKLFGPNIAIFCVFLSSCLWHGITINFIYWGLFQALLFLFTVSLMRANINYIPSIVLIFAIPFARILFSDDNTTRLNSKLQFSFENYNTIYRIYSLGNSVKIAVTLGLIFILLEIFMRKNKLFISKKYKFYRTPVVQFILFILIIFLIENNGTIYAVYGQR